MSERRTYFGFSTPQQRELLFRTWEQTRSVTQACQTARVSRGLFYYWKARFDAEGYPGLVAFESRAAHHHPTVSTDLQEAVIHLRQEHPDWGKTRIAQEVAKTHSWVPQLSPNTVRRILREAGLWPELPRPEKGGARTSPQRR
jgi:transposase